MEFEPQNVHFVSDREKARRNPAKHQGVTFEQAAQAFFDPFIKVVDATGTRKRGTPSSAWMLRLGCCSLSISSRRMTASA